MKRLAFLVAVLLAACGSGPEPVATGPLLRAEPAARFRDDGSPGREPAFSADGRWLATTSASGLVAIRHMPDLRIIRRFHHPGGATTIAFAPDGRRLATSGYDGAIYVWDAASGRLIRKLEGAAGTVWTLDYAPGGDRLAAAGEDSKVRIWSPAEGRLLLTLSGHARNVWEARFSPDGRRLASGSFDATARLWDSATGAALATLADQGEAVVGLAWSPDGRLLATCGDDSTIVLRRASDGKAVRRLDVGNHVYKLDFSPDSRWLVSGGRARGGVGTFWHGLTGAGAGGEAIRIWRTADGALVQTLKMADDVAAIAVSPDGRWLVASGEDGAVGIWRLRAGKG